MRPAGQTTAWQPLTPMGVARFAGASLRRLLLVQFVFALLVAGTVAWFLYTAWYPVVTEAIRKLPVDGEIRAGKLDWRGEAPRLLASGRFLSFAVDLSHSGEIRSPAHVQVEFGLNEVQIISLLGYGHCDYPAGRWVVAFNRTDLEPRWGAWGPPILGMILLGVIIGLMFAWALLSLIWLLPVWLVAFYANRSLNVWQTWKLTGASWLPGTLLFAGATVFYGVGFLDLVQLLAAVIVHVGVGCVYALTAAMFAPKLASAPRGKGNPFTKR